eukprot:5990259-Pleurochrysis_carterae.AAC.1
MQYNLRTQRFAWPSRRPPGAEARPSRCRRRAPSAHASRAAAAAPAQSTPAPVRARAAEAGRLPI